MPSTYLCPASNATWTPAMDEGPATLVRLFHPDRFIFDSEFESDKPIENLCLASTRLPLCFAPEPSGISDRSSKLAAAQQYDLRCQRWCLLSGARRMQLFACLAGTRKSCLLTKAAAFLFALHPEPSGISDQSSKLAAALRCAPCRLLFSARRMQTYRVPAWPALAGAACRHRLCCLTLLDLSQEQPGLRRTKRLA